ncbi:hypothetical protein POSPLADRAFT_1142726 [Postia placenta MAD-698-R-SB12]|uniref:Uncharacterized protein n=1 Tax=Postia placenta MAD-698-R-SB12 TaxID=670580 RepID=A0A1X6N0V0_9APHY|nr:hypothetical protein POSPLADRAFT_1142726 [Postia placenta MAD-698-R-SB12]OSX62102.1 hypothetical protein POSPLADRAFT_1142726 [Postia placenta MAD-698-R-SB12]
MHLIHPGIEDNHPIIALVHVDCIVHAVHLMPVLYGTMIPHDFHSSYSLDNFNSFYVNEYAD